MIDSVPNQSWSWRVFGRRLLVRLLISLAGVAVGGFVYLYTFGFPGWLRSAILQGLSSGGVVFEASAIRLIPIDGIRLRDVEIYKKGVVGPALLECRAMTVHARPLDALRGGSWIESLTVQDGTYRPDQGRGKVTGSGRDGGGASDTRSGPADRRASFRLQASGVTVQGVFIENLMANVVLDGEETRLHDLNVMVSDQALTGSFRGHTVFNAGKRVIEGHLVTLLDPKLTLPVVEARGLTFCQELIGRFDFGDLTPRTEFDFVQRLGEQGCLDLDGRFWIEDAVYRGVDVLRADARVDLFVSRTNTTVKLDRMLMVRPEGIVSGEFTVNAEANVVDFDVVSGWHPAQFVQAVGLPIGKQMSVFRFDGPVTVGLKGRAGYQDACRNAVNFRIDGRDMGVGRFVASSCAFDMTLTESVLSVTNLSGRLMDGKMAGHGRFDLPMAGCTNARYRVGLSLASADFGQMAVALGGETRSYEGALTFELDAEGPCGAQWADAMRGSGQVKVRDGRVFMLPVFGGFSKMMTTLIPGLDFVLRQSDLTSAFVVHEGRAHTEDIQIEGDILSLAGSGAYVFDGRLDFRAQVTLSKESTLVGKVLRTLAAPISMLMEFRLKGTLREPRWYPVNFSRDLLERLGLVGKESDS